MNEFILTQQHGKILEIALNRPEIYNALNLDVMVMVSDALASAATDDSIKGILITGKGKAFCSGGDLKWISQQPAEASSTLHKLAPQFHIAITEIRRMGKPFVAAINGIAAGGRVTSVDRDEDFLSNDSILVSNSLLHEQMLRVLSEGSEAPLPQQEWEND